jgi:hypothetical protein
VQSPSSSSPPSQSQARSRRRPSPIPVPVVVPIPAANSEAARGRSTLCACGNRPRIDERASVFLSSAAINYKAVGPCRRRQRTLSGLRPEGDSAGILVPSQLVGFLANPTCRIQFASPCPNFNWLAPSSPRFPGQVPRLAAAHVVERETCAVCVRASRRLRLCVSASMLLCCTPTLLRGEGAVTLHCTVLYCVCCEVPCGAVWCSAVQCSTVPCYPVLCMPCCAVIVAVETATTTYLSLRILTAASRRLGAWANWSKSILSCA